MVVFVHLLIAIYVKVARGDFGLYQSDGYNSPEATMYIDSV